MTISGSTSINTTGYTPIQKDTDGDSDGSKTNNFQALGQALQSGNLSAAQSAYSALQAQFQNSSQSTTGAQAGNPLATALNQVGQALQSGNVSQAQSAFQSIKGHHHHHAGGQTSNTGSVAAPATSTQPDATTGTSGLSVSA